MSEKATGTLDGIGQRDHSVVSEYWIIGPPGTGKTTSTSEQVRLAAEKYGANPMLVTSFSRAAATELANCEMPIPPDSVGTLHSFCYRALHQPRIAEAHIKDWNRSHPNLALTLVGDRRRLDGEDALEDDARDRARPGDSVLRELNRLRGLMIDRRYWPANVREFERGWLQYKRAAGLLDFCDLIEVCLEDVLSAPGNPAVIFADEAQDLNVMQVKLLRKWASRADYSVFAFDDDQTIYSFIGAAPEALLVARIPDDHKIVLGQSHRVPNAIHRVAERLIRQVSLRHEKVYRARPAEGTVHRLSNDSYKSPEYSILSSVIKHLEHGKTIMFLASCSYMLRPIIQVLRKNAIPFHNPYRKANGLWNPLRIGPHSVSRRILSLLVAHPKYGEGQRQWTSHDLALWTEWLRSEGVLRAGARELVQSADEKEPVTVEQLNQIFEPGALASLQAAFDGDWPALPEWWRARLAPDYRNRIQFPAGIVAKCGPRTLFEEAHVVVGTVHSVKGGQADVVYLFPDLSRAGDEQYQIAGRARDSVIRVFYVGATRARETLYICGRETARSMAL